MSAYGRLHTEAWQILLSLSRRAARRRGLLSYKGILRRASALIGVHVWKRVAAMTLACLPKAGADDRPVFLGDGDLHFDAGCGRAPAEAERLITTDDPLCGAA